MLLPRIGQINPGLLHGTLTGHHSNFRSAPVMNVMKNPDISNCLFRGYARSTTGTFKQQEFCITQKFYSKGVCRGSNPVSTNVLGYDLCPNIIGHLHIQCGYRVHITGDPHQKTVCFSLGDTTLDDPSPSGKAPVSRSTVSSSDFTGVSTGVVVRSSKYQASSVSFHSIMH